MPYFTAPRGASTLHLARTERREVVVMHVAFALLLSNAIYPLLLTRCPQSSDSQHLGLAPGEQPGAMSAWEPPHLTCNGSDIGQASPIETDTFHQDKTSHYFLQP